MSRSSGFATRRPPARTRSTTCTWCATPTSWSTSIFRRARSTESRERRAFPCVAANVHGGQHRAGTTALSCRREDSDMADAWFLHRGQILFLSASPRVPAGFDPVDGEDAVLLLRELASSHLHELRRALPPPCPAAWLQSLQSLPQGLGDGLHLYRRRDLRLSPLLVEEPVVDLADLADDVVEPQQHWVE